MAGIGFGNTVPGIDHALGHSFGKIFGVHHGLSVGLFLPYSIDFQSKITERWIDLCPIFNIDTKGKSTEKLYDEFRANLVEFIRSIDAPSCVQELKNPEISKEDYFAKIDLLVQYSEDDAVSLTSLRPVNSELYRKILEYSWEGKKIDF